MGQPGATDVSQDLGARPSFISARDTLRGFKNHLGGSVEGRATVPTELLGADRKAQS